MSELIRALTLVEGRVLSADFCRGILLLLAIAPTLWGQDTPLWSPAARMLEPRTGHCAIALPDGRLLIAGGTGSAGPLASVEFYGPEDQFRAGPQMSAARTGHRCTILNDGRLLVSGGAVGNSAEVFDPSSGRWSQVGGDVWSAQNHTATLLPGGQVLLAGGVSGGAPSTSIVSFDPASDQLRILVVPLMEGRTSHSAELLPDGRVLFAGGVGAGGTLRTVELLNPTLPRIVPGPDLQTPRSAHGSLNLPDGRILVVGGTNGELDLDNAEVYNPGDNTWRWVNALMASARKSLLTVPLPSGKFLLAGGDLNGTPLGLTETFDPETFVFERAGYLTAPRADIAGAVLPTSGLVLATGGRNDVGPTNLCGILTSSTIRLTDSSGVVPAGGFTAGQTVYLSGSGFSSFIKLALSASRSDDIIIAGTRLLTASLLTAGTTFRVPLFTVVESDLGKTITAVAATPVASVRTSTVPSGRVTLSVTGPSSSPLYSLYQYDVIVRSATPGTPISGFLTVSVSGSSVTRPFAGPFNTPIAVRGCCMQTAGTFTPKITFVPDNANYAGASATGPSVTIPTATQLTSRDANTVYPLFQTVARDWLLTGDAGSASAPNPTGQVTITSTQGTAFSITLPLQSFAPKVSRFVLPFKATFEDRTSPCRFNFSYSGDAFYPPMSGGMCLSVVPAVPTLTASAPPFLPEDFGLRFNGYDNMSVGITFPPELGLVPRQLRVTSGGDRGCLDIYSVGLGTASAISNPISGCIVVFQYADTQATVSFGGGGDLAPASVTIPITRQKWPTVTTLTVTPQDRAGAPVTLTASVDEFYEFMCRSRVPAPSGAIRFFDGTLFLGQTVLTPPSGSCQNPSVATLTVARPVGTSAFRAEFTETEAHLGSVSTTVSVTIR